MAYSDDTYVAWDGVLYEGAPPQGWYLATDNRWWPPQEIIEGTGTGLDDPYSVDDPYADNPYADDPYADNPYADDPYADATYPDAGLGDLYTDPTDNQPQGQSRYEQPAPPDSWAPTPTSESQARAELPPAPTGRARQQQRTARSRGRRKGGFRPGLLIPLLAIALFRCAADSDSNSQPTTFPDFAEPEIAFDEPTVANETVVIVRGNLIEVDSNVPFYIEFEECGPDRVGLGIFNDGPDGTFDVDLTFQPMTSPNGTQTGTQFTISEELELLNGEGGPTTWLAPDDVTPLDDCLLVDASVRRVP